MTNNKGFTLIELLIVIGILAVLSTATVLILDPAGILKETRDAQRLNDLGSLNSAVALMMATATTPDLDGGAGFTCGTNFGSSVAAATAYFASGTLAHAAVRGVDGAGWMAANLTLSSAGAPIAVLPIDPTNSASTGLAPATDGFNYQYSCNASGKYELDARMESTKYAPYMLNTSDGGNNAAAYETGSIVSL